MTKPCILCKKEYDVKDLDFLGRCEPCFKDWMNTPEDKRPKMDVPYTPIFHGGR